MYRTFCGANAHVSNNRVLFTRLHFLLRRVGDIITRKERKRRPRATRVPQTRGGQNPGAAALWRAGLESAKLSSYPNTQLRRKTRASADNACCAGADGASLSKRRRHRSALLAKKERQASRMDRAESLNETSLASSPLLSAAFSAFPHRPRGSPRASAASE